MKGGFLLNVIIRKGSSVFQLLSGKYQPLLVGRNPFLILDFGLDIVDGIRTFNLKGDSFPGESLYENLHATPQTENQVECRLLLDIVVGEGTPILQLLTGEDEPLLVRGDTLLVFNFGLDVVNSVRTLHLQGYSFAR
eukprot:Gb_03491 [translate_table: standard]